MAFKMKNQSMAKLTKAAGDSRVAMKMKAESAMKMKEKSPMEKELVGKQGNLPPELKAKIEAAPTKMKSAMKKDLPGVTVAAERGRKSDGSVDKNSQRYKDAVAAGKRKKENETKQKALDGKVKSGGDLSFAERTQVASQDKNKTTFFTGKAKKPTKESGAADASPAKKLDRSKAKRNDPDDGVVSASEASGGMFMKKYPTKKLDDGKNRKAKERVKSAKSTVKAYVEPGKTKKLGGSIYQEKYEGTGETKYSKKAGRKIEKAEKKLAQAERATLEAQYTSDLGKYKKAARKSRKAIKKADKAINTMGKGGSGRTTRSVQDKYKDK